MIQPLKRPPEPSGTVEEQLEDIRNYLNILYRRVMTNGDEAVMIARELYQSITEGNNPELANLFANTVTAKKLIVSDQLTDGTTEISGDNIKTGTIDANRIDVSDVIADGNIVVKDNLTDGVTQISGTNITTGMVSANRVDVNGIITAGALVVSGDLTDGQTVISGNNILTGEISANRIDVDGLITAKNMVVKNDLIDGQTTISGGNIKTGQIAAQYLNGQYLDVSNATISNCVIDNQCTFNGTLRGNSIAQNQTGSYNGTMSFGANGYIFEQTYQTREATIRANASDSQCLILISASDGTHTASVQPIVYNDGVSLLLLNADEARLNNVPLVTKQQLSDWGIIEERDFGTNVPVSSSSTVTYDINFMFDGQKYTGIILAPATPYAIIRFRKEDGDWIGFTDSDGDVIPDVHNITVTWRPYNANLYNFLSTYAPMA